MTIATANPEYIMKMVAPKNEEIKLISSQEYGLFVSKMILVLSNPHAPKTSNKAIKYP